MASPKVALLLSGCGVFDGTEITEGVSCLVHLSRANADVTMFAPDKPQMHVIDHTKGAPSEGETRNCLVEAARLARGNVSPLDACSASDFDALVVPGGFGAAKNLCDFAVKGAEMTVDPSVEKVIQDFQTKKKPVGLCCIAPVLAAKAISGGVKVTVGESANSGGASDAIEKMGAVHVDTPAPCNTACIDEEKLVVTSAAYMYDGKPHEVDDSVKAMIDGVLGLVSKKP